MGGMLSRRHVGAVRAVVSPLSLTLLTLTGGREGSRGPDAGDALTIVRRCFHIPVA